MSLSRTLSVLCLPFTHLLCPYSALDLHVYSAFQQAMHAALHVLTAATGQQKELPSLPCSIL